VPRVVQVNSVLGSGSTGRIAVALQAGANEGGWRGWTAFGRGAYSGSLETIRIGDWASLLAHGIATRALDRHGLGSRRATRRFVRELLSLEPDVVHLHNIHGYYLHFEVLFEALKAAGIPVVWTLHDCWAFTGHCAYYTYAQCAKWQTECHHCPQKAQYPASWLLDSSAEVFRRKRAAFSGVKRMTIVTPSRWLADEVQSSFLRDYPVAVIPNGIDLSAFSPSSAGVMRTRLGLQADRPVILGVAAGFESPRKGLRYFMAMAPRVSPRSTIVLVGVPKNLIRSLPTGVVAIPRTESTADLAAIYSMADVFVDPTLEDNFPTVILEALACGTPVVTFDTGGCPEQVTSGTGLVVRTGDLEGLIQATEAILRKGKAQYAAECRARSAGAAGHPVFLPREVCGGPRER